MSTAGWCQLHIVMANTMTCHLYETYLYSVLIITLTPVVSGGAGQRDRSNLVSKGMAQDQIILAMCLEDRKERLGSASQSTTFRILWLGTL